MEIASSSRHVNGGDDDDNNNNNNHGKKSLLQQQKENQPSKLKKSKGRRKIQIRRIMLEHARLSTFSKRRSGIFKMANDIATQSGCQIGVLGITPAQRTFAYGNHNIDTIIHRFLEQHQSHGIDRLVDTIVEARRRARVDLLNMNHNMLEQHIEEERLKSQGLVQINRSFRNGNPIDPYWWDMDGEDEISDAQIEAADQDLRNAIRVINEFRQILQQGNMMLPPQPLVVEYHEGGGYYGQPMEGAAQGTMMDIVMEDPSSSSSAPVAPPTNNLDEEELMFRRFFGDYPSSPPGPF